MGLRLDRRVDIKSWKPTAVRSSYRGKYTFTAQKMQTNRSNFIDAPQEMKVSISNTWNMTHCVTVMAPPVWLRMRFTSIDWGSNKLNIFYADPPPSPWSHSGVMQMSLFWNCDNNKLLGSVLSKREKKQHYKPEYFFLVSLHLWNNGNVLFSMRCNKGQPEGPCNRGMIA